MPIKISPYRFLAKEYKSYTPKDKHTTTTFNGSIRQYISVFNINEKRWLTTCTASHIEKAAKNILPVKSSSFLKNGYRATKSPLLFIVYILSNMYTIIAQLSFSSNKSISFELIYCYIFSIARYSIY